MKMKYTLVVSIFFFCIEVSSFCQNQLTIEGVDGNGISSDGNEGVGVRATGNEDGFFATGNQFYGFYSLLNNSSGVQSSQNNGDGLTATANISNGVYAINNGGWGILTSNNTLGAAMFDGKVVADNRVGIGAFNPACRLHIKQEALGKDNGIRLERSDNSNYWNTQINSFDDYTIWYNGTDAPNGGVRAWIQNEDATYHNISDKRLKDDIEDLDGIVEKVMELRPVTYRLKTGDKEDPRSIGFIAQEVEALFPELVSENYGMKGLNYANFSVLAIEVIQHQQEDIQKMKNLIGDLKAQLNLISESMCSLEKKTSYTTGVKK